MPTTTLADVPSTIIGAWKLLYWREVHSDGSVDHPLGPDAVGQLMYDPSGRMSVQLVQPHQDRFASDDWREATEEEMISAWPRYFGYFGTYGLDDEQEAVVHHIEGGWFPNLEGTEQIRQCRFDEKGRLHLDAHTP